MIVFPDLVATARQILLAADDELVVTAEVPTNRPEKFVQLRRTGGTSRDVVIDGGFLTVDCWAISASAARVLAQQVRGILHAAANTVVGPVPTVDVDGAEGDPVSVTVYRVAELAGPSDFPDAGSGAARVRQSFQIGLRGQPSS